MAAEPTLEDKLYAVAARLGIPKERFDKRRARFGDDHAFLASLKRQYRDKSRQMLTALEAKEQAFESQKRRQVYERERKLADARLADSRRAQSLGQRADQALAQAVALSNAKCQRLEGTSGGGRPGSRPPTAAIGFDTEKRETLEFFYRSRLELLLENFERDLDKQKRTPLEGTEADTSDVKDERILTKYAGYKSTLVAELDRSVGSYRTVERVRTANGKDPTYGRPLKREAA